MQTSKKTYLSYGKDFVKKVDAPLCCDTATIDCPTGPEKPSVKTIDYVISQACEVVKKDCCDLKLQIYPQKSSCCGSCAHEKPCEDKKEEVVKTCCEYDIICMTGTSYFDNCDEVDPLVFFAGTGANLPLEGEERAEALKKFGLTGTGQVFNTNLNFLNPAVSISGSYPSAINSCDGVKLLRKIKLRNHVLNNTIIPLSQLTVFFVVPKLAMAVQVDQKPGLPISLADATVFIDNRTICDYVLKAARCKFKSFFMIVIQEDVAAPVTPGIYISDKTSTDVNLTSVPNPGGPFEDAFQIIGELLLTESLTRLTAQLEYF